MDWKLKLPSVPPGTWPAVWLISLIIVAVTIASVVFSASQVQGRLSDLRFGGGPLSPWKADALRKDHYDMLKTLDSRQDSFDARQKAATEALNKYSVANESLGEMSDKAFQLKAMLERQISKLSAKLDPQQRKIIDDKDLSIGDFIRDAGPVVSYLNDKEVTATYSMLSDSQLTMYAAANRADAARLASENAKAAAADSQAELLAARKQTQAFLTADSTSSDPVEQQIQLQNTILELGSMLDNYPIVYRLALAPYDVLVLMLIVAMGTLGGVMQVAYALLSEPEGKTAPYYMLRPFLGVIMAFVVYIVAKTGIPLINDTTRASNATFNPYFISFLGIISGLLSERALAWVRQLGSDYFKETEAKRQRWANQDLAPKFSAVSRDPKLVQAALGISDPEFAGWLDGTKPISDPGQKAIALALDESPRQLFTDMPPP